MGTTLDLTLEVENRSGETVTFQEALHTYCLVGDVELVTVDGLDDVTYIDKADGMRRKVEGSGGPESETSRTACISIHGRAVSSTTLPGNGDSSSTKRAPTPRFCGTRVERPREISPIWARTSGVRWSVWRPQTLPTMPYA